MQRSNESIRDGRDVTIAAFIRVGLPIDIGPRRKRGLVTRLVGVFRAWRQRERERRALHRDAASHRRIQDWRTTRAIHAASSAWIIF
jgi:hypothetical protein